MSNPWLSFMADLLCSVGEPSKTMTPALALYCSLQVNKGNWWHTDGALDNMLNEAAAAVRRLCIQIGDQIPPLQPPSLILTQQNGGLN